VIEVKQTHKGAAPQRIVVRFPSSHDVAWYKMPKFEPGQESFFLLKKDTLSKDPTAVLEGSKVQTFVAPTLQSVQPKSQKETLMRLIPKE